MKSSRVLSPDDADTIERLVEKSMPYLAMLLLALAACVVIVVALNTVSWVRSRSPVEKLLRARRFG